MTKDLSRIAIRARWEQQIEKAVQRFGGKGGVASRAGVHVRTVGNWLGVKPNRGTKGRGSNGRRKVGGVRIGTIPRDAEFADACVALGISANYILFNRRPELLEDERTQDWVAEMCAWLASENGIDATAQLDGPRIRAFVLAATRAAEAHDAEVFNEVLPVLEMGAELLGHQCRGEDDDGFHTYVGGLGEPHQRERWEAWRKAADERFSQAPFLKIFATPRWTKTLNTDRTAAAIPLSNVDIRPIPELRVSIVTAAVERIVARKKRKRAK